MSARIIFIVLGSFILLGMSVQAAVAESQPDISVNGARIKSETPAYIADGRTMIPLRLVANALNLQVDWEAAERSITLQDEQHQIFRLTIDSKPVKTGSPFP